METGFSSAMMREASMGDGIGGERVLIIARMIDQ